VYICLCHGVTDSAIREAVSNGVRTFRELSFSTGCGLQCGSCATQARALLTDFQKDDQQSQPNPRLQQANAA